MPHSQHGRRRVTDAVAADGDAHGSIRKGESDTVLPRELMTRRGVPVRAPHKAAREPIQCWAVAAKVELGAPSGSADTGVVGGNERWPQRFVFTDAGKLQRGQHNRMPTLIGPPMSFPQHPVGCAHPGCRRPDRCPPVPRHQQATVREGRRVTPHRQHIRRSRPGPATSAVVTGGDLLPAMRPFAKTSVPYEVSQVKGDHDERRNVVRFDTVSESRSAAAVSRRCSRGRKDLRHAGAGPAPGAAGSRRGRRARRDP